MKKEQKNVNDIKILMDELKSIRNAINNKSESDKEYLLYLQKILNESMTNYHIIVKNLSKQ